jgi:hypothetical protein
VQESLLSDLQTPYTPEESRAMEELIRQVEEARYRVESSDFPDWQRRLENVAHLRIRSSNTLKRGDRDSWVQANTFVEERVRNREWPTWSAICQVNALLCGQPSEQVVRETRIFIGPLEAPPPEHLKEQIRFFSEAILPMEKRREHPLVIAALLQYWIVSLHPFKDANGRTAVLIADWIGLYAQYFPQVFEMQLDALIGHFANRVTANSPARAVFKVLQNTLNSYQAFLS